MAKTEDYEKVLRKVEVISSYAAEITPAEEGDDDAGQVYLKVSPSEQKTVSWAFKNTGPN